MAFIDHKYYLSYEGKDHIITISSNNKESLREDFEDLTNHNVKIYATNIFTEGVL